MAFFPQEPHMFATRTPSYASKYAAYRPSAPTGFSRACSLSQPGSRTAAPRIHRHCIPRLFCFERYTHSCVRTSGVLVFRGEKEAAFSQDRFSGRGRRTRIIQSIVIAYYLVFYSCRKTNKINASITFHIVAYCYLLSCKG